MKVQLSKKGLAQDVEMGLTRKEIANKYGLVQGQLNKAMVMAGLKGVKAKTVKFEFVEDEEAVHEEIMELPEVSPMERFNIEPEFGEAPTNRMPINTNFDEKIN